MDIYTFANLVKGKRCQIHVNDYGELTVFVGPNTYYTINPQDGYGGLELVIEEEQAESNSTVYEIDEYEEDKSLASWFRNRDDD